MGIMSFTRTAARADAGRVGAGRCCGVRGVCGALLGRSGGGRCDGVSADARRAGDRGGADGFSMSRSPRGDARATRREGGPGLCGARKLSASSARRIPSSSIGIAAIWLFVRLHCEESTPFPAVGRSSCWSEIRTAGIQPHIRRVGCVHSQWRNSRHRTVEI